MAAIVVLRMAGVIGVDLRLRWQAAQDFFATYAKNGPSRPRGPLRDVLECCAFD